MDSAHIDADTVRSPELHHEVPIHGSPSRPRRRAGGARAADPRPDRALRAVAGDVSAVEPALYRAGLGGCRLEDLLLVTDTGAERLTDFPYELTP